MIVTWREFSCISKRFHTEVARLCSWAKCGSLSVLLFKIYSFVSRVAKTIAESFYTFFNLHSYCCSCFFSQHAGSAGQKAAGPTEKTPVSHSVSLHVSEPTNFAHLHVRKLFDEGKFPDYRTSSSLHAQNRPLTRSDPVS